MSFYPRGTSQIVFKLLSSSGEIAVVELYFSFLVGQFILLRSRVIFLTHRTGKIHILTGFTLLDINEYVHSPGQHPLPANWETASG